MDQMRGLVVVELILINPISLQIEYLPLGSERVACCFRLNHSNLRPFLVVVYSQLSDYCKTFRWAACSWAGQAELQISAALRALTQRLSATARGHETCKPL